MKKRTQDLKKSFHDAAQFYLGWRDPWKNKVEIFHKNSKFVSILKLIHINNYSE
jgi:CMP-N-acetylneuraminic acid synthetase